MDMQKMQVRTELERMVYNFALLGKIENDTATELVSLIGVTIGGDESPELRGKIIVFPSPSPVPGKQPKPSNDDKQLSWSVWYENFRDIEINGTSHRQLMILRAFYTLKINSLEELAKTPLDKIKKCNGIGEKSLAIILSILEKNGFIPTNRAAL
jgi:hypothetical protein